MKKPPIEWNTTNIFKHYGGVPDLHARLVQAGYDVNLTTVRMWERRGKIPVAWLAVLLVMEKSYPDGWITNVVPEPDPEPEMEDIF